MTSLDDIVQRYGERTLFLSDGGAVSYARFGKLVEAYRSLGQMEEPGITPACRCLPLEWTADSFAKLLAAFKSGQCVFLGTEPPPGDLSPFVGRRPLLILRTGGTTGAAR
ncbi:MAG TPA: hypothetical protein VK995_03400, partial [Oceanipulchritudo sp.]|nr:hypothetical protein [Oceanipulchritudo sp.]